MTEPPIIEQQPVIEEPKSGWISYVLTGIIIVLVIFLIWYGYSTFIEQQSDPEETTKCETETEDPQILEYNLSETIENLEKKQRDILKDVSDNLDI